MDQKYIDLFDKFTHGTMSRRGFMERLARLAGGAAAAAALVPILQNNYAEAGIVPKEDERLVTETATYDVDGETMSGYLARLKGGGKRPGVIVIHENRGLNPISRTSHDGWRSRDSWPSHPTRCRRWVARPKTRTGRAK